MFDPTTLAAYIAAGSPTAKAEAVRDSLGSGTLHAVIYDDGVEQYSGTFSGPLTASGGVLSADSKLTGLYPDVAVPDGVTWTLRIENADGTRWVEGTFGGGGRFQVSRALAKGQSLRLEVSITSPGVTATGSFAVTESGSDVFVAAAPPGEVPLSVSGVPDTIVIEQSGQYDFGPRITGGVPPYYVAVTAGTLPTGVTWASDTMLQAASDATISTSGDITFRISDSAEQQVDLTIGSFTVASVYYYAVNLQWTAAPDATFYTVEKLSGASWVHALTTSGLTYTDSNVSESSTYNYRVRATDGTNTGSWVTVAATTPAKPVIAGADEDWAERSTGPGVVWAHDFRNIDEMRLFRNATSFARSGTKDVLDTGDEFADPQVEDPLDPRLGSSMALVHRIVSAELTQECSPTDTRIYVNSHADFPDPAVIGHPYGGRSSTDQPVNQSVLLGAPAGSQYSAFSSSVVVSL